MHQDIERLRSEVGDQSASHAANAEVTSPGVALARADLFGDVLEFVVSRVESVDFLEVEQATVAHTARLVELAPPEHGLEDAHGRRPGSHAYAGTRLGQRFGDRETKAACVSDSGDQGAPPAEVDRKHGRAFCRLRDGTQYPRPWGPQKFRLTGRRGELASGAAVRASISNEHRRV